MDFEPEARRAEIDSLIRHRRSIRRYDGRPVPRDVIAELLQVASWAPSPHNRQPWRFAVVTKPSLKDRLAQAMGERLRRDRSCDGDAPDAIEADVARSRLRICAAPALILVCLSMAEMDVYPDPRREHSEYLMAAQATAAAAQTLMLAAEARGVRSCWMCAPLFCPDTVKATLNVPIDWEPQALITLGYSADPGRLRPRRSPDDTTMWVDDLT